MASTTLISVGEYLRTSYSPDCDYVDGEVRERNLGEKDHARLQGALTAWFRQHRRDWNIRVYPELRVQVSATRFRVPDVCVLSRDAPDEQIITHPPIICIEILSPSDTLSGTRERVEDYSKFGVENIWIVDPATRGGYDCKPGAMIDAVEFRGRRHADPTGAGRGLCGLGLISHLAWRPTHGASTEEVEVEMVDCLSTIGTGVDYGAKSLL